MRRYRSKNKGKLFLLILLVLGISVGYALLSSTLSINGIAGIKSGTWDIHWENVVPNSSSTVTAETPSISENATKVSFSVNLELPGDYYEFDVDAKNDGDWAGTITKIDSNIYKEVEDGEDDTVPSYIKTSIVYKGTDIEPQLGDILYAGEKQTYTIRVEFDREATEVPDEDFTVRVEKDIVYSQWDTRGKHLIKFDPNGGSVVPSSKEVEEGGRLGSLPTPMKEGYAFIGWFTGATDGTKIDTNTVPVGNVTYYAHWTSSFATFDTGTAVNAKMKKLAGDTVSLDPPEIVPDTNVTSIVRSDTAPGDGVVTDIVSVEGQTPIYAWFDNGTIYYYSEAEVIYSNQNANSMFANYSNMDSIDLSFNTINTTSMSGMFANLTINNLDLSNFDTSNVTNMGYMFASLNTDSIDLSGFDTSKAENISGMFASTTVERLDLSSFDTSNVTDMNTMFAGSQTKSIDFSSFNTSKVVNVSSMFASAKVENLDLSNWDVSNVENFGGFLAGTSQVEEINISGWKFNDNVTSLLTFFGMGLSNLKTVDMSNVDLNNVTNLTALFNGDSKLTSVNFTGIKSSNLTTLEAMFYGCSSIKSIDLSGLDKSKVTNMGGLVSRCSSLEHLNMSNSDFSFLSSETLINHLTSNNGLPALKTLNLDNVTFPTSMSSAFAGLSTVEEITFVGVNTSNVTNMNSVFNSCSNLKSLDLSDFDTSNVTTMSSMFNSTSSIKVLDLRSFDTRNVTDMGAMFVQMPNITTIIVSDDFVVDQVTVDGGMFYADTKLVGGNGTKYDSSKIGKEYAHYDYGIDNPGYFNKADGEYYKIYFNSNGGSSVDSPKIISQGQPIGELPTPSKQGNAFDGWYSPARELGGQRITADYIPTSDMVVTAAWDKIDAKFDVGKTVNIKMKTLAGDEIDERYPEYTNDSNILEIKRSLTEPTAENKTSEHIVSASDSELPIYAWFDNGTIYWWSAATKEYLNEDASNMFRRLKNVVEIDTSFGTSNVTNMSHLFEECGSITEIDVSGFDTRNVTDMSFMFSLLSSLTSIDVSNFDTSNVTNMECMFSYNSTIKKIDLSNFNTSKVTNMHSVVYLEGVEEINLSNWDFSNYTGDCLNEYLFYVGMHALKKIKFDNAILPANCHRFLAYDRGVEEISLRNADASNVTDMSYMFAINDNLRKIDLTNLDTSNVTTMERMFYSDKKLESIDVSSFNTSRVTNMMGMFQECDSLKTLDLSMLDTSNVTVMKFIAGYCDNLEELNISNFNFDSYDLSVSNSYLYNLFYSDPKLMKLNADNIVFPADMNLAFNGGDSPLLEELTLRNADTSKVTNMGYAFSDLKTLKVLDLSSFDTSNVINMGSMFNSDANLKTIIVSDKFVVDQVVNSTNMFNECNSLVGGRGTVWDTNHIDKEYAHYDYGVHNPGYFNASDLELYGVTFNPNGGSVDTSERIVYESKRIGALPVPTRSGYGFDGWYTTLEFTNKINQAYIPQTDIEVYAKWSKIEAKFDTGKTVNVKLKALAGDDVSGTDSWGVADTAITKIERTNTAPDISSMTDANIISTSDSEKPIYAWFDNGTIYYYSSANQLFLNEDPTYMYYGFKGVTEMYSSFNTSLATNMEYLFYDCYKLESLDTSTWNTSNVTNMLRTFAYCRSLTTLDLSGFDTHNVKDFYRMITSCNNLEKINLSNWDISNWDLTKYSSSRGVFFFMLYDTPVKKLILDNVIFHEDGYRAFYSLTSLEEISFKNVDTSRVTTMHEMFYRLKNVKKFDLTSFDTSKVTDMYWMFQECESLVDVDLSSFNTERVTNMNGMFKDCTSLKKLDLSSLETKNVTTFIAMADSPNLVELNISNFDFSSYSDSYGIMSGILFNNDDKVKKLIADNVVLPADSHYAFGGLNGLEEISLKNIKIENVTNMNTIFENDENLKQVDLSSFDTRNVTNMNRSLYGLSNTKRIFVSNKFVTNQVSDSTEMFGANTELVGERGTVYDPNHIDKEYARIDTATTPGYFTDIANTYEVTLNTNDGDISSYTRRAIKTQSIESLPTPTRSGYTFAGWYTELTGGIQVDETFIPTSNMTLYAHWN